MRFYAISKVIPLIYPSLPFLLVLDKSFIKFCDGLIGKNEGEKGGRPRGMIKDRRRRRRTQNIFNQKTIVLIHE
jgi:hypothetical protein